MIKKIVLVVFFIVCFTVIGQVPIADVSVDTNVFPKEKTFLSVNSNLLLAGELLQYKTYGLTLTNKPSTLSKIMYVSLSDERDSVVFNHKLKIEIGSGQGDFFIPATLKTGKYTLICFSNFSRNNVEDAFSLKNIYIINSFIKSKVSEKIGNSEVIIQADSIVRSKHSEVNANRISIKTDKTSYDRREKVGVTIENGLGIEGFGNYLLSVRRLAPLAISDSLVHFKGRINNDKGIFYIPEMRGELISGKIEAENSAPIVNKTISLTLPGKDYIFKLAKTNSEGRFFFSINEAYQTSNANIQVDEPNRESYRLVLDSKDLNFEDKNINSSLTLDPNIKDWLQERSIQLQIENGYFNIKKDSVLTEKTSPPFYDGLGADYVLDDYTRFPTVRETFVEVVKLAAVRKEGNTYRFEIFNDYDPDRRGKFNQIDPLVIMDGMLVQNNTEVIDYNPKEIKSIRVLPQPYRYGPNIYSGIISISTKKGDFSPALNNKDMQKFDLPSPLKKKQYYFPDYSQENYLKRIPDYRVQLLWQPNVQLTSGKHEQDFYTSDVPGTYEIVLEGFSNSGKYNLARQYFVVK